MNKELATSTAERRKQNWIISYFPLKKTLRGHSQLIHCIGGNSYNPQTLFLAEAPTALREPRTAGAIPPSATLLFPGHNGLESRRLRAPSPWRARGAPHRPHALPKPRPSPEAPRRGTGQAPTRHFTAGRSARQAPSSPQAAALRGAFYPPLAAGAASPPLASPLPATRSDPAASPAPRPVPSPQQPSRHAPLHTECHHLN